MDEAFTKAKVDAMIATIRSLPGSRPDTIIVSAFSRDTMLAEMDVLKRFAGRNWRRIKRERRKAYAAAKAKHQHRPQVAFAVDSAAMKFNWSRQIQVDRW